MDFSGGGASSSGGGLTEQQIMQEVRIPLTPFEQSGASVCRAEAVSATLSAQLDKQVTLEVLQQFLSVRTWVTPLDSYVKLLCIQWHTTLDLLYMQHALLT